jgi:Na+/H+ antiporter NhaD/arsenite permease-like protein
MAAEFGNEGLVTVGVLFVIATGLTETGGMGLLTARLLGQPRSVIGAQLRMMFPVTVISAFLNNTPVVAMFVPVVNDWCKKAGISPSKLFIPLSYAAILGGVCTLIGTSTNLVVQGMMIAAQRTDPTMPRMGFWTIGAVGLPVAVVGIAYILLTSRWLLIDRLPASLQHADPRQYTVEMMVQPGSAVDGSTIEHAGLRNLPG